MYWGWGPRWIRLRVRRATARGVSDRLSDLSSRSEGAVRHQLSLWTEDLPRVRGENQGRRQAVSAVQQNGLYLLARLRAREISWRIWGVVLTQEGRLWMEGETWGLRTAPEWRSISRGPANWVSFCSDRVWAWMWGVVPASPHRFPPEPAVSRAALHLWILPRIRVNIHGWHWKPLSWFHVIDVFMYTHDNQCIDVITKTSI